MRTTSVFLIILILTYGCGRSGDETWVVHSIDPDSIEVIENGAIPQEWNESLPLLVFEDEWAIGDDPGVEAEQFSALFKGTIVEGPDEQVGILNRQPLELRVFDRDGRFLWKAGREGGGPGEFRIPNGLVYQDDIGWVVSDRPKKTVFDEQGEYIRTVNFSRLPFAPASREFHMGGMKRFWYTGISATTEGNDRQNVFHLVAGIWPEESAQVRYTITQPPMPREEDKFYVLEDWPTVVRIDDQERAWIAGDLPYQIDVIPHSGEGAFRIRRDFDLLDYDPRYRRDFENQWQRYSSQPIMWPRLPEKQPAIRNISRGPDGEMWVFMKAWVDSPLVQVDVFSSNGVYERAFLADYSIAGISFTKDHVYRIGHTENGAPLIIRSRYSIRQ